MSDIAAARRFYNGNVRDYNVTRTTFTNGCCAVRLEPAEKAKIPAGDCVLGV